MSPSSCMWGITTKVNGGVNLRNLNSSNEKPFIRQKGALKRSVITLIDVGDDMLLIIF